ncbi:nucleotidyltransferase family protein, partial [Enterococcus faecium]|uniref:nucleotidyltransferase family protein n=1 Tax=Enterococcus faecium TaxID=1352 RepID=UPI0034E967C1
MKAIILAAGRGQRMMPLTASMPKPMLTIMDKPLIEYHIERLKAAGITEIVINLAWYGNKITEYFADGQAFGVNIYYSQEPEQGLETAGGII